MRLSARKLATARSRAAGEAANFALERAAWEEAGE